MSAPVDYVRARLKGGMMYMGDPDGPMRFIPELGVEVPTYIAPRDDLKSSYKSAGAHKSVDYHVPPGFRRTYRPHELANYDPGLHYPVTASGSMRCNGINKKNNKLCMKAARNFTPYCSNHGGALHPADKAFLVERGIIPSNPERLTRLAAVELGIIPVHELTNEEISRQQILDENGTYASSKLVSAKIAQEMRREFFKRADDFVRENVMDLLTEMRNIAISQVAEDRDKIQAIQWLTERALGKTPDVLITNKTDSPFEEMITDITSGSRESFRNEKQAALLGGPTAGPIDGEFESRIIIDQDEDEDEDEGDEDDEFDDEPSDQPVVEIQAESPVAPVVQDSQSEIGQGDEDDSDDSDDDDDDDEDDSVYDQVTSIVDLAQHRKDRKDAIRRRRNRKFAAKAQGLTTLDNLWYELSFKEQELADGTKQTRMKLVSPDDQKAPRLR